MVGAFEPVIDVRGLLVVAMLVAATLPGQARAATVAIEDGSLRFTASPGERNAVAIDMRPDSRGLYTWWVQDDGAALATGSGCAPTLEQGRSGARCEAAGVRGLSASLGDGDDGLGWQFITPADVPVPSPYVIDGGSGDDQLSGGRASERLIGGPGRDQLFGGGSFDGGSEDQRYGSGDDYLEGGPGDSSSARAATTG